MANGHGGRRPGAGRPRKPLAEKLLDGNPGKQKLKAVAFDGVSPTANPPEYLSYYGSKKAGTPDSEDIYRETVQWLEQTGCLHLVNVALVLDYAIAKAHWYECERFITSQGLYYSPGGKKLMENPVVDTSVKYFKMADIAWSKIWDIVAQNCEHSFGGHQRFKILRQLGYTEIQCVVLDIDEQREKALNVALNKIGGEFDSELLSNLLRELDESGFDVRLTGFEDDEISKLFASTGNQPGAMVYLVMSVKEWGSCMAALEETGFHWSSTIIWSKDTLVLSRKDYNTQYEPIWYGWLGNEKRRCPLEDHKQSDVWQIDRPKKSEEHPTMKPIALAGRAIENSSHQSDVGLDLFGGSGTTLLACEQLARTAHLMELDPRLRCCVYRKSTVYKGDLGG